MSQLRLASWGEFISYRCRQAFPTGGICDDGKVAVVSPNNRSGPWQTLICELQPGRQGFSSPLRGNVASIYKPGDFRSLRPYEHRQKHGIFRRPKARIDRVAFIV